MAAPKGTGERLAAIKADVEGLKAKIERVKAGLANGSLSSVTAPKRQLGPNPKKRKVLQGHYNKVYAMDWAGDGERLISARLVRRGMPSFARVMWQRALSREGLRSGQAGGAAGRSPTRTSLSQHSHLDASHPHNAVKTASSFSGMLRPNTSSTVRTDARAAAVTIPCR
jgi:hypothetical protein